MSTKVTLSYGKEFHFYQEIFDNGNVYLQVNGHEFEASNGKVLVQIPIEIWEKIIEEWPQSKVRFQQDNNDDWGHDTLEWLEFGSNATSQDETVIFERKK